MRTPVGTPFVSRRWLLENIIGLDSAEINAVKRELLEGGVVPVIRLSQEECIALEDDWDVRALNAGLSVDMTVLVGTTVTQGLVLESGCVLVGAVQLRALYRAASHEPRVEPVMRRIEATGMSIVDLLGGLG